MQDLSKLSEEERSMILARRAYMKKWRAENKDKVKASNERFYKKLVSEQSAKQTKEKPSE